jgi:hypothetical protein
LFVACDKNDIENTPPCESPGIAYYSDYFVFIADDGGSRLVIPMDFNWRPTANGFSIEFKSWYGTSGDWPIAYLLDEKIAKPCEIPGEVWEHTNNDFFSFNAESREIQTYIGDAPEIVLTIPDSTQWIQAPSETGNGLIACKTTAMIDGTVRNGWLVYERIRRMAVPGKAALDFGAFFWMPIVYNNNLYHFRQHDDNRSAVRWIEDAATIQSDTLSDFQLNVTATSADSISGRTNIPDSLAIICEPWYLQLHFGSTGSQVGYGPMFPNGLAYYRQSMLEAAELDAYGMLELILEDD